MRYLNFSHNPLNNIGATAFVKLFFDFETRIVDLQLSCLDGALEFALELARVKSEGNLPNLERFGRRAHGRVSRLHFHEGGTLR